MAGSGGQGGLEGGGLRGGLGDLGGRIGVPGDATAGPQVQALPVRGGGPDGQPEVQPVVVQPPEGTHAGSPPDRLQGGDLRQGGELRRSRDGATGADCAQDVREAHLRRQPSGHPGLRLPQVAPPADGEQLGHYKVELDTSKVKQFKELPSQAEVPKTVAYDLWLDDDNRMRKMTMEMAMGGAPTKMEVAFTDWGEPVDIAAPPASEIVEQPQA